MSDLKTTVKKLAANYAQEVIEIRRHLHQNPELSFEEFKTSQYLQEKLKSWGLNIDAQWIKTAFTVVIDSKKEGPTLGLRADMDALPIIEQTGATYQSKNKGIMHACGHDVHSAALMGVTKILKETKENWKGKVVLIFQAAEEKFPGGASLMLKEGLLKKYKIDRMLAQHVYPEMEVGKVGFRSGMYMASADEIYLTVKGKGGHAALPHKNIDPIIIAANILIKLQQLSSRIAPPTIPTVLSFGKIEGLGATNVIPDKVKIEGTLRTLSEEWRAIYHKRIKEICHAEAKSMGGECEVDIKKGYPFLVNDEKTTIFSKEAAEEFLGVKNVEELALRMTAEDFAYFSQKLPVCFYRLGVGNKNKGIKYSVHHLKFDIDEDALEIGSALMAYIAIQHLNHF